MNDVRKVAVLINLDTDPRSEGHHRKNVEDALRTLEAGPKGKDYETFVVSSRRPASRHDHFIPAEPVPVAELFAKLREKTGPGTELVLYTTGHGMGAGDDVTLHFPNGHAEPRFGQWLDALRYASRTLIADPCEGGIGPSASWTIPVPSLSPWGARARRSPAKNSPPGFGARRCLMRIGITSSVGRNGLSML